MKKQISGMATIVLLVGTICCGLLILHVKGTTITVPDDYQTIQEAINNANNGDAVFVKNGTYYEHIVVNKSIALFGENRSNTTIDANGANDAVLLNANNILISNFTIKNSHIDGRLGIRVYPGVQNVTIHNNIVTNNAQGGIFSAGSNINITRNLVTDNGERYHEGGIAFYSTGMLVENDIISNYGIGISIVDFDGNSLLGNNVTASSSYGISLTFADNTNVTGNFVKDNQATYGVILWPGVENSTFVNNTVIEHDHGVYVLDSCHNNFTDNWFTNNTLGIVLENWGSYGSDGNTISSNIIEDNSEYGIVLKGSNNNTIQDNALENNGVALGLGGGAHFNFIYNNSILGNTNGILLQQISDNNNITGNTLLENQNAILLGDSDNNTILKNVLSLNDNGIYIGNSVGNNLAGNNITDSSASYAISIEDSSDHTLIDNNVVGNKYGIMINSSPNNKLVDNNMTNNIQNFGISGFSLSDYIQDINVSNTVDDRFIYYWINRTGETVPSNAGYVAIINSTNIIVDGQSLEKNGQGILLAYTNNTLIKNNNIMQNYDGITLRKSSNNTIINNKGSNNNSGVRLVESFFNNLTFNFMTENGYGVYIGSSSENNTVAENIISSNTEFGGWIEDSANNTIATNSFAGNYRGFIFESSGYNMFTNNSVANNTMGIFSLNTLNNTIYHNNFIDNTNHVVFLMDVSDIWDNGYPSGGNYWDTYSGADIYSGPYQNETGPDGIGDNPLNLSPTNVDNYPLQDPWPIPVYNLAILNVTSLKISAGQGYNTSIYVTVMNQGIATETLNVTVFANTTTIKNRQVVLGPGESTELLIDWNTTGYDKSNYTISAFITPIPYEMSLDDNNVTDGWTLVTIPGDVDADRDVDIFDLVAIGGIIGSERGDPDYDPNCDINIDDIVDIFDYVIAAGNYGQSW